MDTQLNEKKIEKEYVQNDEIDDWINSLYSVNATFEVEFEGKYLKFNKRIPMSVAFEISKIQGQDNQLYKMIEVLSLQPKINQRQAKKLPQDILLKLKTEFEIIFPQSEIKK
ncbi:MAG: hypothetical protein ACTSQH_07545 [Candidatus Hodarchaeales archaeon]